MSCRWGSSTPCRTSRSSGRRVVVVAALEAGPDRRGGARGVEIVDPYELGLDELIALRHALARHRRRAVRARRRAARSARAPRSARRAAGGGGGRRLRADPGRGGGGRRARVHPAAALEVTRAEVEGVSAGAQAAADAGMAGGGRAAARQRPRSGGVARPRTARSLTSEAVRWARSARSCAERGAPARRGHHRGRAARPARSGPRAAAAGPLPAAGAPVISGHLAARRAVGLLGRT